MARIEAFTFSSQDHGRLSDKHISKHSRWNSLKITVGWLVSTYPSIHFSLDEDTLKITVGLSGLWCVVFCVCMWRVCVGCVCTCGVVCGVGGVWVVCVYMWRVCGVGGVWVVCVHVVLRVCGVVKLGTLSLSLALSLLSPLFSSLFRFFLLSLFSLFFFFFFFSWSLSCSCSSSLSPLLATNQPTRRPTSRHLNVIWRRASALQSVLSLLLLPSSKIKKRGDFLLQEYFRRGIYFYYGFK